ncbi:hypothetical protein QYE76_067911 [Lolium multiflorum]|uniref:RNase H type-1 domain-containing protein n=1 Tax=Lolium multiflorum TaxID=4521 RepID=A0AAD8SDA0_LOLMU|nr:hypothetical protein QYE76_067911 [Lolium multiflorum]
MKPPTTKKELQRLIGKINFVRRFISNLWDELSRSWGWLHTPCTNNVAEYEAIRKGMELLLKLGQKVELFGDSKLVISQLTEEYKCESESLFPLWMQCRELMAQFKYINFNWIPRLQNAEANDLAQMASGYKDVADGTDVQGLRMQYGKWSPNWHGPYRVDQVLKGNAYMLEQLDGVKFPVAINGQHLKKYFPSLLPPVVFIVIDQARAATACWAARRRRCRPPFLPFVGGGVVVLVILFFLFDGGGEFTPEGEVIITLQFSVNEDPEVVLPASGAGHHLTRRGPRVGRLARNRSHSRSSQCLGARLLYASIWSYSGIGSLEEEDWKEAEEEEEEEDMAVEEGFGPMAGAEQRMKKQTAQHG